MEKERYYCRKGFYSWNVLGIVNDLKVFIMASVRFPGSTHDSRNHNESWMKAGDERQFDFNHPRFHVGDAGFMCQKTCLIPVKERNNHELTRPEKLYNKTLTSFRSINEHAFGNLKDKFPILHEKNSSGVRKDKSIYSQVVMNRLNELSFSFTHFRNKRLILDGNI